MTLTAYQRDIIARTVLGEASNQGIDGMAAVANVIKNRSESGSFPSDPADVALQHSASGIYQFSAWNSLANQGNRLVDTPVSSKMYQSAVAVVDDVFDGSYGDNTGGATFYQVAGTGASWASKMFETVQIGAHVFYTPNAPVDLASDVLAAGGGESATLGDAGAVEVGLDGFVPTSVWNAANPLSAEPNLWDAGVGVAVIGPSWENAPTLVWNPPTSGVPTDLLGSTPMGEDGSLLGSRTGQFNVSQANGFDGMPGVVVAQVADISGDVQGLFDGAQSGSSRSVESVAVYGNGSGGSGLDWGIVNAGGITPVLSSDGTSVSNSGFDSSASSSNLADFYQQNGLDLPSSVDIPEYITISKEEQVPANDPIVQGDGDHWDPNLQEFVLGDAPSATRTVTVQVQELNPAWLAAQQAGEVAGQEFGGAELYAGWDPIYGTGGSPSAGGSVYGLGSSPGAATYFGPGGGGGSSGLSSGSSGGNGGGSSGWFGSSGNGGNGGSSGWLNGGSSGSGGGSSGWYGGSGSSGGGGGSSGGWYGGGGSSGGGSGGGSGGWSGGGSGGGSGGWSGGGSGGGSGGCYSGGGGSGGGWGGGSGGGSGGSPVVLDLTGKGINVTPISSSNMYFDMAGDGEEHHTAWAGVGNGVLVLDLNNSGVIDQRDQVDFTVWDPTAKTDMQALLDVFDTNHDGQLDSGDADWADFKVMVTNADGTTSLETLAQLGITSINLTSNNQEILMPDGSRVSGVTTYTKSDGSTGEAADASFAFSAQGYAVDQTVTHNADGSTTIDNKSLNTDGTTASEIVSTTSADGLTRNFTFDDNGDGVADRQQTDVTINNGDGSTTETISNFNGNGSVLTGRQVTTTSADGKTVTISRDATGSGHFDEVETIAIGVDGTQTVTATDLHRDGTVKDVTTTVTSADGLSKTVQMEDTGNGVVNSSVIDGIVVAGNGTRTETSTDYAGNGTAAANEIAQSITTTSADGSTRSVTQDLDGNGTVDLTTSSTIVHNADGSTTTTQTDTNGNGSLRDKSVTQLSADGNTRTVSTDADGDGTTEYVITDAVSVDAGSGTTTDTTVTKSGTGNELSETVTSWSADGKTRSTSIDSNGDGSFDKVSSSAIVGGNTVQTNSVYAPNGAVLESKTVSTTSSDGLSRTTQVDENGDGVFDSTQTTVRVINADHSSTVTATLWNGGETVQLGKTVTTTSADGLSSTVSTYLDAQSTADHVHTDTLVVNADGSTTETVIDQAGTNHVSTDKAVTTISADRLTSTTERFVDSNSSPTEIDSTVVAANGAETDTSSIYGPNGAALLRKTTTVTSADGLSSTTTVDKNGDGATDATATTVRTLNTDGSTTDTTTAYLGVGMAAANEVAQTVVTTSGNGLSITTLSDVNGDGTFDGKTTDVTVINADGSRTETVSVYNGSGSTLIDRKVITTCATGLSVTAQSDADGNGNYETITTDVTVLNTDGSTTETKSVTASNGALLDKVVTTLSADGLTKSVQEDSNGDGVFDLISTTSVSASGVTTQTDSVYSPNGATLVHQTVTTTSADGLSRTTKVDANGDGVFDSETTIIKILNSDKSTTVTTTHLNGAGTVQIGKTVETVSGDGMSSTVATYLDAQTAAATTVTDVKSVAADGSKIETVTSFAGTMQVGKEVDDTSADGLSTTRSRFVDGYTSAQSVVSGIVNADGSKTKTESTYSTDGTILVSRTTTTTSADGLSVTTSRDKNGDGAIDETRIEQTTLNADGSHSVTTTLYGGATIAPADEVDQTVVATSANGLSVTTKVDQNGDGVFDTETTDVTVLNADGSRTETLAEFNGSGSTQLGKTTRTTSASGLSITTATFIDAQATAESTTTDVTVLNADGSRTETISVTDAAGGTVEKTVKTTSGNGLNITSSVDLDGNGINDEVVASTTNADGSVTTATSTYNSAGTLTSKSTVTRSASGLTTTTATDSDGNGSTDLSKTDTTVLNADGSHSETISNFGASGTLTNRTVVTNSADGLSKTTQWDDTGSGSFTRSSTDVTTVNADGSTTQTISNLNANGTLHDKEIVTTSADKLALTTTKDLNGDGVVDQTLTQAKNADGSSFSAQMDGTIHTNGGVQYGGTNGRYEIDSANGLSKVTKYDGNGDGVADKRINDTTVLNADGSKAETITDLKVLTDSALNSSAMTGTYQTLDSEQVTTSANGMSVTTKWDPTGSGTYTESRTEQTVLNSDRSTTKLVSTYAGAVLAASETETVSGDGLTRTDQLVDGGTNGYSEIETDTKVLNSDGTSTETVTDTLATGFLLAKTVTTTSADGRTVTVQRDPGGTGAFTQSQTDNVVALADGTQVETVSDFNATGTLRDKTTTTTSGDGMTKIVLTDADGDGHTDQKKVSTLAVDGSSTVVTTDLTSTGATRAQTTVSVSADGLTVSTQKDIDGDGIIDKSIVETKTNNADGSTSDVTQTFQTSQVVSGVAHSITPVLQRTVTVTKSADNRTETTTTDVDGNGSVDTTSTSVFAVDGTSVTTLTNDSTARAVAPLAGEVLWISAAVSTDKQVASKVVTTTSLDGLSKTVQADYDGNGTYEHTENWQTQIDGSQVATITDVNSSNATIARGIETISADGLTTTLEEDTTNAGFVNHIDSATTRADGSTVETVTDLNSNGTLNQTTTLTVGAAGQVISTTTTHGTGASTTLSAASATVNYSGTSETVNVTGTNDIAQFGNAVDVVNLSNDTAEVDLLGNAQVTAVGDAADNFYQVDGRGNSLNVSGIDNGEGYVFVDYNASLTLFGSDNDIALSAGSDLTVWSNSYNYLDVGGGAGTAYATISSGDIDVEDGTSLVLSGTTDSAWLWGDATLTVSGATTGDDLESFHTGNTINASSVAGPIIVHKNGSLTLNGTGDKVQLSTGASVTVSSATDTVEAAGVGDSVTVTGGGGVVAIDAADTATVANNNNTINVGKGASATVTGVDDTFVFAASFGIDTITGYTASGAGGDTIDVSHTMFADWAHLLADAKQSGSDVIITADSTDSITLKNTTLASLQQSQFHFT